MLAIKPSFVSALDHVSAYHIAPAGKISVSWKREGQDILLDVEIPQAICATGELESGFCFEDGSKTKPMVTGVYKITRAV